MEQTKSGYVDKIPNDDFSVGVERVILRKAICYKINAMKVHIEDKVCRERRREAKTLRYIT